MNMTCYRQKDQFPKTFPYHRSQIDCYINAASFECLSTENIAQSVVFIPCDVFYRNVYIRYITKWKRTDRHNDLCHGHEYWHVILHHKQQTHAYTNEAICIIRAVIHILTSTCCFVFSFRLLLLLCRASSKREREKERKRMDI